jgi:DNA-binding LacI/PurR family transcriptional regulator
MPKAKVTNKDVAEVAGVSPTTVSFVLNNVESANISEATKSRVWSAARKLGYVPNAAARSLAQGRSNNIGVVLIHTHEQIFLDAYIPNILTGLGEVVQRSGFRTILERIEAASQHEAILSLLDGSEVAGLVVHGGKPDKDFLLSLIEHEVPVVFVGDLPFEVPYSVYSDNLPGVREMINHLIGLGHQQIACISYAPENQQTNAMDRLDTYFDTLLEHGIQPNRNLVRFGSFDPQSGYDAMQNLLEEKPRPTAVFGMNDMMAIGAIAAIQAANLRVPEDIAVVGFDDDRFAAFTNPPLTTMREAQREIGIKAGQMLIDLMNEIEPENPHILIPTELIIRQSCGSYLI